MSEREEFIKALHEVPPSILDMLDATFGNVPEVEIPDNVEKSLICQGKVAAHFNNYILKPLSGLPIVELALRIGQNNPSVQAMLLSMLKVTGSLGKNTFQVNIQEGGSYPTGTLPIKVTPQNGSAVSVTGTLSGPENLDFDFDKSGEDAAWTASPAVGAAGEYSLDISVEFSQTEEAKTKHFNITMTEGGA